jgi:hypothetical protein
MAMIVLAVLAVAGLLAALRLPSDPEAHGSQVEVAAPPVTAS